MKELIRQFNWAADRGQLIELWQRVFGYESAHNAPPLVIDKKLSVGDGLLFVAEADGKAVGSVIAGCDGQPPISGPAAPCGNSGVVEGPPSVSFQSRR